MKNIVLKRIFLELLQKLERIGEYHEELYDSAVRQALSNAIRVGFVKSTCGIQLPEKFGMHSEEGDRQVRAAIAEFIEQANVEAKQSAIERFHDRLHIVQDRSVQTPRMKRSFDDFFGYSPPELFDEFGNTR
jgi:hypothetical protein